MLAKAIANEANVPFLSMNGRLLLNLFITFHHCFNLLTSSPLTPELLTPDLLTPHT